MERSLFRSHVRKLQIRLVYELQNKITKAPAVQCSFDTQELTRVIRGSQPVGRTPPSPPSFPLASRLPFASYPMTDDVLGVRYGQKIRLATTSAYAAPAVVASDYPGAASHQLGIGYYEKNGRHGILSCVPPLGERLAHLFNEDEYLVLDPTEQRSAGEPVHYGHTVVLVNQHGMVWNNKTRGITGYVGPRPRNMAGEMYVAFHNCRSPDTKKEKKEKTMSAPALLSSASTASNVSTSASGSEASFVVTRSEVVGPPVRFGDANVAIVVVESNRHSQKFNKRLSNFKKPTSRIAGGYICCDGKGVELRFTLYPARPRVEQISMLNKLITSYEYGQKILLSLALLESSSSGTTDKAKKTAGGLEQTEIRFTLSNHATAVLPGALLQQKLLAHAVADDDNATSKDEKESVFVLPLRNGPGELLLKLTGVAPQAAIGKLAGSSAPATGTGAAPSSTSAVSGSSHTSPPGAQRPPPLAVFYQVVKVLRLVPVPVFALAYAAVTHVLWRSLGGMDDGLQRELVVLVLVAIPMFYVAVKVEHPFSAFFEPPSALFGRPSDPLLPTASPATLKLIVVEYRFTASSVERASPVALSSGAPTGATSSASSSTALVATSSGLPKRFLLAEKGDEAKGLARYKETLAWRRDEKLSQILFVPSPGFKVIKENYPHYYHKRGKNGEPVYYEKPGKINLKALKGAGLNLDDLMHNYIMVTEFLWQIIEPDDNKKCISVVDVEGIGLSDFRGEAVEYVKKAAAVSGKHYPERCAYIIVINIPSWFNVIWNVVKTMIDEVTREKVVMVRGKKNILDALKERIPLENIPEEYGGLSEGSSPEETMLHDLMAFLNKDEDAPATNPIAHLVKETSAH